MRSRAARHHRFQPAVVLPSSLARRGETDLYHAKALALQDHGLLPASARFGSGMRPNEPM